MDYVLDITTQPTVEPVTVAQAKQHCRVLDAYEDDQFEAWIPAARKLVEQRTSRALTTTTFTLTACSFPSGRVIELPRSPLLSVVAVRYYDEDNAQQTFSSSNYRVVTPDERHGWLELDQDASWPALYDRTDAVEIEFTAGYGATADDVPAALKQAVLILVDHFYNNRSAIGSANVGPIALAFEALTDTERVLSF